MRVTPAFTKNTTASGVLMGAKEVRAGDEHSCVLMNDATVRCFGENGNGQLGNHSTTTSLIPVVTLDEAGTAPLSGVSALAIGATHNCALFEDTTVQCWGTGSSGELGNGDTIDSSLPVTVKHKTGTGNLTGVTAITAGTAFSCALLSDTSVQCWGSGTSSDLPVSMRNSSNTADLIGVTGIAARGAHACAAMLDGSVFCWGDNAYGELGDNSTTPSNFPVRVKDSSGTGYLSHAVGITAGENHSCALLSDSTVQCWGRGPLGDNTSSDHTLPIEVQNSANTGPLTGVMQLTAGSQHTCALLDNYVIQCWGANGDGELGLGHRVDGLLPQPLLRAHHTTALTGVSAFSSRVAHSCAVMSDHSVQCWGENRNSQLGDNIDVSSPIPVPVKDATGLSLLTNVSQAGTGRDHSCALLLDSTMTCWGSGSAGQLGHGIFANSGLPVTVRNKADTDNLTGINAFAPGLNHTCVLLANTQVQCWGDNSSGQLGNNDTAPSALPVDVKDTTGTGVLSGVLEITAGDAHTCALLPDHTVQCWGKNTQGQLGNGLTLDSLTPVITRNFNDTADLSGVDSVIAGFDHTCALMTDTSVQCWGGGYSSGANGDGTGVDKPLPSMVKDTLGSGTLTGVSTLALGWETTCALFPDKTAVCWGENGDGQLGVNSTDDSFIPVVLQNETGSGPLTGINTIQIGNDHTCALLEDSSMRCWGWSDAGNLGTDSTHEYHLPAVVLAPVP